MYLVPGELELDKSAAPRLALVPMWYAPAARAAAELVCATLVVYVIDPDRAVVLL